MRERLLYMLRPPERSESTTHKLIRDLTTEIRLLRKAIENMDQQIQDAFAQLRAEVQQVQGEEASAVTLIQGLQTQLQDALNSGNDPAEVVATIQDITNQLSTDAAPLAAAVAGNSASSAATSSSSSETSSDTSGGTTTPSDTAPADTSSDQSAA